MPDPIPSAGLEFIVEVERIYAALTCFAGSATVETRDAMGALVLDGIDAVLAGRKPANLVS